MDGTKQKKIEEKERNEAHLKRNCEVGYEERRTLLTISEEEGEILTPYLQDLEGRIIESVKDDPKRVIDQEDTILRETLKSAVYLFGLAEKRIQRPMNHGALILGLWTRKSVLGTTLDDYKVMLSEKRNIFKEDQIRIFTKKFLEHYERLHFKGYGLDEFDGFTIYRGDKAFAANQEFGVETQTYYKILDAYGLANQGDATRSFKSPHELGSGGYYVHSLTGLFKGFGIVTSDDKKKASLLYAGKILATTRRGEKEYTFLG